MNSSSRNYVINRSGVSENLRFDKITDRNIELSTDLDINAEYLSQIVIKSLKNGMKTSEIDELSAESAFCLSTYQPDYDKLAARIIISNLHKSTCSSLIKTWEILNKNTPMINPEIFKFAKDNEKYIENALDFSRDYMFSYFGFRTLCKSYLLKADKVIVERPQHMFMRVSLCIHGPCKRTNEPGNIFKALETYHEMSQGKFVHATPTLINAGKFREQLSSCFLLYMNDSIDSIFKTLSDCSQISKFAGGIGLAMTEIRSKGAAIRGSNGTSDGIIPMIRVYNETARYVNQCFVPETIIYTIEGMKEIQNIIEGDLVLTRTGEYKRVKNIFRSVITNEEILNIQSENGTEIVRCTKQHQILVMKAHNKDNESIISLLSKPHSNFDYISASEIKEQDITLFPVPIFSYSAINILTDEYLHILGIIIRDGIFTGENMEYISFVSALEYNTYLVREYLLKHNIEHYDVPSNKFSWITRFKFRASSFFLNTDRITYFKERGKKIIPKEFLFLSKEKTKVLLRGILNNEIDGKRISTNEYFTFTSNSRDLILGVKYQLLKLDILCTGDTERSDGIVKKYFIHIPAKILLSNYFDCIKPNNNFDFIKWNDHLLSRVQQITKEKYSGIVYDIEIEDNHNYVTELGVVHNSGARKGSFVMYIEPWHPEIMDFLSLRDNRPPEEKRAKDMFLGLWIPDIFMKRVKADMDWPLIDPSVFRNKYGKNLSDYYGKDFEELFERAEQEGKYVEKVKAQDIWKAITTRQEETGLPYMLYKDSINEKSNQKNIGTIKSSNLCVAPDTYILTKYGYFTIASLENMSIEIWNGMEWSKVKVRKTGVNQKLLRVYFTNGEHIDCTPYHKFPIIVPGSDNQYVFTEARQLTSIMKLLSFSLPSAFSYEDKKRNCISRLFRKKKITNMITDILNTISDIIDVDGKISKDGDYLIISDINKNILKQIRLLLQTIGVDTYIYGQDMFHLYISGEIISYLLSLGLKTNRLDLSCFRKIPFNSDHFVSYSNYIKNVENIGMVSDTYCFVEPKRNMGMFNGVLLGNCTEIVEYTDDNNTAVCTLASLALPKCIRNNIFDFNELGRLVEILVENLNHVMDKNYYPIKEAENASFSQRAIGIGVQGLADVFFILKCPWKSEKAKLLNRYIFECIYYFAVKKSAELALKYGSYPYFQGSPIEKGIFSFDMWNDIPLSVENRQGFPQYDWEALRTEVRKGMRNSLLIALMPTATTASILGNVEAFEPLTSNIYSRTVLSGEFPIVNQYLYSDLKKINLWTKDIVDTIIMNEGSIANIKEIPEDIRDLYKTAWEISKTTIIDMARDRSPFIDQSQSLNIYFDRPSCTKLTTLHFMAWEKGMKTSSYYMRSKSASTAIKFGIFEKKDDKEKEKLACSIKNKENCEACSS